MEGIQKKASSKDAAELAQARKRVLARYSALMRTRELEPLNQQQPHSAQA